MGALRVLRGAPLVSDEVPGNVCIDWHTGDAAGANAAFAKAAHIVTLALDNHRIERQGDSAVVMSGRSSVSPPR